MRNLELKFRCADLDAVRQRALALGAVDSGTLHQHDTFFPAPLGRLKLRDFGTGQGELIAYRRPDATEVRGSDYLLAATSDPDSLRRALEFARRLLLWRHTRIHLDEVEALGSFVELETVIAGQPEAEARQELERVVAALELPASDRIASAYVDLNPDCYPG